MKISPELAEKLGRSWLCPTKIERQTLSDSILSVKKYAKGLLLDVGCGERPYERIFSDAKYIGADLRAKKGKKGPDVCADATALPFKSNTFDTVLSTQVLEHVPEPKGVLEEAWRVLKNGGHLIITAPMSWELHEVPHDYYRYTKYGFEYIVKNVGFEVELLRTRGGRWRVIGQKLSSAIFYAPEPPKNFFLNGLKRVLCALIQLIFSFLDNTLKDERETLGHILVAKKLGMPILHPR